MIEVATAFLAISMGVLILVFAGLLIASALYNRS